MLGAGAQIVATATMLATMNSRSFVVTIAYIKTEAIQAALFGLVFLGDRVTPGMVVAILVATAGVVAMSLKGKGAMEGGIGPVALGLFSGAMFAISAVGYRGAILSLGLPSFVLAATFTVTVGLLMQAGLLTLYLALRDRAVLLAIVKAWRPSVFAGLMGATASEFWFLAFALTSVANVRTLGAGRGAVRPGDHRFRLQAGDHETRRARRRADRDRRAAADLGAVIAVFQTYPAERQVTEEKLIMKAIVVKDQTAGTAGMKLVERPEPQAAINDVIVQIYASGFVPTELAWPSTWTDRRGRDRTPSIPGHELAGLVTALGYGTTGLSVGQRVFGLADWYRDGALAEYVAIEARNLAPLPGDVDFTVGASLPISGLTAWQGLFQHGRLQAGQSVLVHGAAGAVGAMVTQLAREAGAHIIGTGRAADRQKALDFGAQEFVDLQNDALEDVGGVDLVFDLIGGDIGKRSARLVRAGGTLVSIVGPVEARPADGMAVDFVVEVDRVQLNEIVQRVRDGRLRTNIGNVSTLDEAVAAFNSTERRAGKTVIRVRP